MMADSIDTTHPAPLPIKGLRAIDADIHPRSPRRADLLPYLDEYWSEIVMSRDVDHLELTGYPESAAPFRPPNQDMNADAASMGRAHLDPLGLDAAILNVASGLHGIFDPYMAAALCSATNRWLADEWLSADGRLRASLVVPFQHPEAAVAEIQRYAGDERFVQVLAMAMGETPLGRRHHWPIYKAAVDNGFAIAIHNGSSYRHAPTQSGFPSFLVEDQIAQAQGFANQVGSLLAEGVLAQFPAIRIVLIESGVTWLPGLMWRMGKDWRGARIEVPWVKTKPAELIRTHFRLTTQPFDGPAEPGEAEKAIEHLGSEEMLLFATDFPHDHGQNLLNWPQALPRKMTSRIARDNFKDTYPRLEIGR
ncbi:amidohydrolase family protein [Mesorhizobium sp. CAU 1741]|uniref:amidohydrolase family protein n=1 Tax=Mesorhizobium sp. CAU 1741 TaxID=3140366 RepID=UPI00325BB712